MPALIGIGELDGDGVVPPLITRQAKQSLPNSFEYTFPATGHVIFASYSDTASCARAIAEQFMASPTRRPSSSCIASLPQYDYTP